MNRIIVFISLLSILIFSVCKQPDTIIETDNSRIEDMTKTLLIAYPQNLSKWTGESYSYFFEKFSDQYNVPWYYFPALIYVESRFNPTLSSHKNAHGIAQLIPKTMKSQCEKLNIRYKSSTKWNDIHNIVCGLDYFCEGYDTTASNPSQEAIKRYIAGPNWKNTEKNKKYTNDIKGYYSKVMREAKKLHYIYKGVTRE